MKVTVISIIVDALGTEPKGLKKNLVEDSRPYKLLHCWNELEYLEESLNLIGLVWFYDISTIVDYLMPNLAYIYKLDVYNLSLTIQLNISHLFTHS